MAFTDWAPLTVTISSDNDLTDAFDGRPGSAYMIFVPSTFDGTQIRFVGSYDNSTYSDVYDEFNVQVTRTVTAGKWHPAPEEVNVLPFWKIATVTAQSGTDTVFYVASKRDL